MMDSIFNAIESLVTDFSWRRVFFIIFISFVALIIFFAFEVYTGHFKLSRLQKSTNILEKLVLISEAQAIKNDDELTTAYKEMKGDLNNILGKPSLGMVAFRGIIAAVPFFIFGLFFAWQVVHGEYDSKDIMFGLFLFSLVVGLICALLPHVGIWWVNYIVYPLILNILVILFLFVFTLKN